MPDDRSVDFAFLAFTDARGEILRRLEIREKLVELYVLSSLALLGAIATIYAGSGAPAKELFALPPMLALAISFRLRSHVDSTEAVAEFIRRDLNEFLLQKDAWAPHWDWATHSGARFLRHGKYGGLKKSGRFVSESMSLHFPCFFSMLYLFYTSGLSASWKERWSVGIFIAGIFMFLVAFENTRKSYRDREDTKKEMARSSEFWRDVMKQSQGASK
ncbi:MAG: hypothetical protein JNN02_00840 [Tabrizicola sp.]|nr:hypothetical protein [Tabrizicola sp.]